MTPETIKAAFVSRFGANWASRGASAIDMECVLTSILCGAPPSAPLREPATMVATDRAAEMAEKMVVATSTRGGILFPPSPIAVYSDPAFDESRNDTIRDLRTWLADALRAYGDELLEKVREKFRGMSAYDPAIGMWKPANETIASLKSTPPKDNR